MSEQRAPQQNGCQCGMCFFLAMEGSKYCVAHRGIMESFDRKRAASLPESQPSPSGDEQRLYMIQDTRSYCGNDVMWWCVDGAGYTTDVDKAWKLPKAEAESKCCRATDVIWPAKEILDCSRRAFDMQRFREIRAALQESPSDTDAKKGLL